MVSPIQRTLAELMNQVVAAGGIVNGPVYAQLIERGMYKPPDPTGGECTFFSEVAPVQVNPAQYSSECAWGWDRFATFANPWQLPTEAQ